ncbi:hypothetical protein BC834DRAFT_821998 [Gloeopeniophorella convolvens]|nr:hypothetical protein BC834DRAFT_821998 [Gloeopeniophorella convolvens]
MVSAAASASALANKDDAAAVVHGLSYPPDFLSSLPVLLSRPAPHTPIRALSASQFATLHHAATIAHAPDHILFPFLHGLEGDNEHQNSFFAVSRDHPVVPPRFRGLIWVACEDDDTPASDDEDDDDGSVPSDDSDSDEHDSEAGDVGNAFELDMDMDIDADSEPGHGPRKPEALDPSSSSPPSSTSVPGEVPSDGSDPNNAPHMHPVKNRAPRIYTNTNVGAARDRSASSSSSTSSSSQSLELPSPSTPATSFDSPTPSCAPLGPPSPVPQPRTAPLLAAGFKPRELLQVNAVGNVEFIPLRVPDGISLRNFDIQLPIYATLSDIVIYSRRGATRTAFAVAEKFKQAVEARAGARIPYNVFVLEATPSEFRSKLGHLLVGPHTVNFAQREKDEMRELTRASEILTVPSPDLEDDADEVRPWTPGLGQVFLGNVNDVPFFHHGLAGGVPSEGSIDLLDSAGNAAADGMGYDVCIECHDRAPAPTPGHLRGAEEHIMELERRWEASGAKGLRPPPNAAAVVHLPFPLSPSIGALTPFLEFLERLLKPELRRGLGRPAKILIWSSDGYTESSVLALSLIMAMRSMTLPEAYLELQVAKRRSFFVYQSDIAPLKRIEGKLARDRRATLPPPVPAPRRFLIGPARVTTLIPATNESAMSASYDETSNSPLAPLRRPRASTSPLLPSLADGHQVWFDDPRFDGSFPSRVLPFLYLGNLNHASNAYMLHALGITHVVSVGECALIPPPTESSSGATCAPCTPKTTSTFIPGTGPERRGSLYIEEREGRIKVLDIKGVCDDGIDTLQPQLAPICSWIDRARAEGGKVLVHCRVGVSRSATVAIAYVMQHLRVPLVDAYLIVRSRRLSVLIQPNMRLLYNLCGWEVRLAHERAGDDPARLRVELARCVNWPFLAREVHLLNEKYLHP